MAEGVNLRFESYTQMKISFQTRKFMESYFDLRESWQRASVVSDRLTKSLVSKLPMRFQVFFSPKGFLVDMTCSISLLIFYEHFFDFSSEVAPSHDSGPTYLLTMVSVR